MTAGHTPGPWSVGADESADQVFGADGGTVADCWASWTAWREPSERLANARLIAAAPDLLEALRNLHANLAEYQRINHIGGYGNFDMRMARVAIAKATGGAP